MITWPDHPQVVCTRRIKYSFSREQPNDNIKFALSQLNPVSIFMLLHLTKYRKKFHQPEMKHEMKIRQLRTVVVIDNADETRIKRFATQ